MNIIKVVNIQRKQMQTLSKVTAFISETVTTERLVETEIHITGFLLNNVESFDVTIEGRVINGQ